MCSNHIGTTWNNAPVAQLEAHLTTNEKVVGSNPAGGTKKYAQMGKWSNLSVCKTDIRRFESGSGLKIKNIIMGDPGAK